MKIIGLLHYFSTCTIRFSVHRIITYWIIKATFLHQGRYAGSPCNFIWYTYSVNDRLWGYLRLIVRIGMNRKWRFQLKSAKSPCIWKSSASRLSFDEFWWSYRRMSAINLSSSFLCDVVKEACHRPENLKELWLRLWLNVWHTVGEIAL